MSSSDLTWPANGASCANTSYSTEPADELLQFCAFLRRISATHTTSWGGKTEENSEKKFSVEF